MSFPVGGEDVWGAWISISQLPTSQNKQDEMQFSSEIALPICHEKPKLNPLLKLFLNILYKSLLSSNYSVECPWRK